jgi:hypothetical protein
VLSAEVNQPVSTNKPSLRAAARANVDAFARNKPRLRAVIGIARFIVQTSTGPVLHCPLCNEDHRFLAIGSPPRLNSCCPSCGSLERHRLLGLYFKKFPDLIRGKAILHFAPEAAITRSVSEQRPGKYLTADLRPGRADVVLSIENVTLSDQFDMIIASHILEHVNDRIALRELYRSLKPGGIAIIMVPIVEGWPSTYENNDVKTSADRLRHFGQEDHVRVYGRDVRDRIREAGFDLTEITANPADCLTMGLQPGEAIFVATKRGAEVGAVGGGNPPPN